MPSVFPVLLEFAAGAEIQSVFRQEIENSLANDRDLAVSMP